MTDTKKLNGKDLINVGHCPRCKVHSGKSESSPCKRCLPEGGFKNMGEMWEVV